MCVSVCSHMCACLCVGLEGKEDVLTEGKLT